MTPYHRVMLDSQRELTLYGPGSALNGNIHLAGNGDFAASLGSFIFNGRTGGDALADLLKDFDPADFSWKGVIGSHVLLIYRQGRLNVVGDGLGACQIYSNAQQDILSNSFVAMCELARPTHLDNQGCYEYVIGGAVYGGRSLADGIRALPANTMIDIAAGELRTLQRPSPIGNQIPDVEPTLDAVADYHCAQLDTIFEPIARCFPDKLRLSFSGGFDSRLMLAMLMRHGARPMLFVYGDDSDEDVRIARHITAAEKLPLECIDKGLEAPLAPDAFAEAMAQNLFAFDGWRVESGLFDHGADRRDRLKRHLDDQVPINGSLGEIYRNFFYMPDRRSSSGAVISTFYSRFDPATFTARFDEATYRDNMARAMRASIGARDDRLERWQVEQLYPNFRGRYWTGRDAQINQRFGNMFFPFLEHVAISDTARVPVRLKDLGHLQGRMIARVSERLANYPSDYGFTLNGPRPFKYRLKTWLGTQRPPALRKRSYRLLHRKRQARAGVLSNEYLSRVIDTDFPIMRTLFRMDAVNSADQFGQIAALEYLAQRFDLRPGEPQD